jgi:hypothetical protein
MNPVEISHIAQGDVPSRRASVVHPFVHKSGGFPQRSLSSSRMEVIPERSDTPNQEHHEQEKAGPDSTESSTRSRAKDWPSLVLARPSHCDIRTVHKTYKWPRAGHGLRHSCRTPGKGSYKDSLTNFALSSIRYPANSSPGFRKTTAESCTCRPYIMFWTRTHPT